MHNIPLEKKIIGTVIVNPDTIHEIPFLQPEHFVDPKHNIVWTAISEVGIGKLDRIILESHLASRGKLDLIGGSSYLIDLVRSSSDGQNVLAHAEIIFDLAWKRNIRAFFEAYEKKATDTSISAEELIGEAQNDFYNIVKFGLKTDVVKIGDVMNAVIENIKTQAALPVEQRKRGVPTGFIDLDRVLGGGLKGGNFVIIGGSPGMGKSVVAQNIAKNAAKEKYKVLYFTLEMSAEEVAQRILAMDTKVELTAIRDIDFDHKRGESYLKRINEQHGTYDRMPLLLYDKAGVTPLEVASVSRHVQNLYGVDLIVVDYLQIMNGRRKDNKNQNREQEVAYISESLKNLARELDVPIVCLAQIGKDAFGKRPTLGDIRESAKPGQDCDIAIFLHRPELFLSDDAPEKEQARYRGIMEMLFAKFRNGNPDSIVELGFQPEFQILRDIVRE